MTTPARDRTNFAQRSVPTLYTACRKVHPAKYFWMKFNRSLEMRGGARCHMHIMKAPTSHACPLPMPTTAMFHASQILGFHESGVAVDIIGCVYNMYLVAGTSETQAGISVVMYGGARPCSGAVVVLQQAAGLVSLIAVEQPVFYSSLRAFLCSAHGTVVDVRVAVRPPLALVVVSLLTVLLFRSASCLSSCPASGSSRGPSPKGLAG